MMRQLVTAVAFATITMGAQQAIAGGMPEDESKLRRDPHRDREHCSRIIKRFWLRDRSKHGIAQQKAASASPGTSGAETATGANTGGPAFIAIEDDPLVVDASAIMDNDGMGNVQVQWQISKDGTTWMNLSGAVQQSFTPREIHVAKCFACRSHMLMGRAI